MLQIEIPGSEYYDESKGVFVDTKPTKLVLEHSLYSMSKWESEWKKPFLSKEDKTVEETIDYIRKMTIAKGVDPSVYYNLTNSDIDRINNYILDPMTATTFRELLTPPNREIITSELIYYWMTVFNIPFECQKWHLNRLLTLVKVCNIKSQPAKKMSKGEILKQQRALNQKRRSQTGSRG